jgi:hypothetical protein
MINTCRASSEIKEEHFLKKLSERELKRVKEMLKIASFIIFVTTTILKKIPSKK